MAKLQVPPVYSSNESFDMVSWFKLLWKWVTDLYTADEIDVLIEANRVLLGTPITTTSGTAHDFTGIPSGTRRISMTLVGISTNGTSPILIQLGDAGGIETTGYLGAGTNFSVAALETTNVTTGLSLRAGLTAVTVKHGVVTWTLANSGTFQWVGTGLSGGSDSARSDLAACSKALSAELTQIRLTTVNGTDTFDAGAVNITYER